MLHTCNTIISPSPCPPICTPHSSNSTHVTRSAREQQQYEAYISALLHNAAGVQVLHGNTTTLAHAHVIAPLVTVDLQRTHPQALWDLAHAYMHGVYTDTWHMRCFCCQLVLWWYMVPGIPTHYTSPTLYTQYPSLTHLTPRSSCTATQFRSDLSAGTCVCSTGSCTMSD